MRVGLVFDAAIDGYTDPIACAQKVCETIQITSSPLARKLKSTLRDKWLVLESASILKGAYNTEIYWPAV